MSDTTDSLTVRLGERSYPIHFGGDLAGLARADVEAFARAGRSMAVITDGNLARAQAPVLKVLFGDTPMLELAPGEETKSLGEFGRVLDFMAAQRLDRTSVLVAAGGGVIGDLAGFAAAAYQRGIDFVQVPTTLLAMVDSSVGGKTGLNLKAGKNLAGAFHQPRAVYIATDMLATLPPREFAAGMAEVIKYGMLADASLFAQLESSPLTASSPTLASVIRRCCEIKARIVEADERELAREGGRALLNLGHTFGHAIEQVTGYGAYLHGEAVAIGLAAAARLSEKLGNVFGGDTARVERVLAAHALPVRLRESLPLDALMTAMARDKKVRSGTLRFVVLNSIGDSATRSDVPGALVEETWREVGAV
ncbi:3-dehydroquinate synthase [Ereboglobus sp. PH5-5]|uniref:3-dehydroquinate synthase n=1 Tax=Ereboglobus sp. PH5-5 TaxID=2940529 RepID=UPI00240633CF|nr:3-dehydroquinate synthase [Ereboglobus sp. PH5-5]MDF9832269.1 3-dehydroquinate synthase [Ereboglobus sp. PH5-5]